MNRKVYSMAVFNLLVRMIYSHVTSNYGEDQTLFVIRIQKSASEVLQNIIHAGHKPGWQNQTLPTMNETQPCRVLLQAVHYGGLHRDEYGEQALTLKPNPNIGCLVKSSLDAAVQLVP